MIRVLFEITQSYYWQSFLPLVRIMQQDKNYDIYLGIGKNHIRIFGFLLLPQKDKIKQDFISKGYKIADKKAGFDVIVCGDTPKNPKKYGNALICNIDHGVSIKSQRYRKLDKLAATSQINFVEGGYREQKLKKLGFSKDIKIVKVGMPKLDRLFDGSFHRNEILSRYNLDKKKKTLLFAPSYKPTSIYDLTNEFCKLQGYNLIIKLHPYSWSGKYVSHRQHRFVEKVVQGYKQVCLIPKNEIDILPLLFASDTIITEGSSVMNEFLSLGKCGVIYHKKSYHSDGKSVLEEDIKKWLSNSFVHIDQPNQLKNAVKTALNPSPKRQAAIYSDRDKIFSFVDGKSSVRVKRQIEKFLKEKK